MNLSFRPPGEIYCFQCVAAERFLAALEMTCCWDFLRAHQSSGDEKRYSPAQFIESIKKEISGNPDHTKISTSYVERQNLTMRMAMRRFTRLTNGFSKKVENLSHAVALHFMYYNFCRIHQTLRVTPAMEAGITNHVWGIEELLELIKN